LLYFLLPTSPSSAAITLTLRTPLFHLGMCSTPKSRFACASSFSQLALLSNTSFNSRVSGSRRNRNL
jgi:hypothetical protein